MKFYQVRYTVSYSGVLRLEAEDEEACVQAFKTLNPSHILDTHFTDMDIESIEEVDGLCESEDAQEMKGQA